MSTKSNAASPAASGPAGSLFEGQVGAHYLLTMLVGAEPRGLPGTTIDRVEFQRAAEGRPLDDVVICARNRHGEAAVLEVQVKRSLTFAPADPVFRDVVRQIAKAASNEAFWNGRHELAIATAKTSRKIDGAYQDVLGWARRLNSGKTFFERLRRKGSASDDMRTFVQTFRDHLKEFGCANDDEMVWRVLGKVQILTFDFTAEGSASEDIAKERAVRALHSDETLRAGALWTALVELAIRIASVGGESSVTDLTAEVGSLSFRLAGQRRFAAARAAIADSSRNALADIGDKVGDASLSRIDRLAELRAALDRCRYLEIRGDAGVGKSGLLKHLAEQVATESGVIVLSPGRTPPRGWSAMRAELGFDGSARELLADLAGDGGATIFVDNLDLFTPEERKTVVDLIRAACDIPGLFIVATARKTFGSEEPSWIPASVLEQLGGASTAVISELNDVEIEELRLAAPRLSHLLTDSHPARDVTRNLYRLGRLAERPADEPTPRTEIDMAVQWWQTADGKVDNGVRERARLLRALAHQALYGSDPLNVSDRPAAAIDQLIASESLRDFGNDRVAFRHDVLREWGIANLLSSEPDEIEIMALDRPASAAHARGIELCARIAIERNPESAQWQALVERLSRDGVHGSWRRSALLALVRSEVASDLLNRAAPNLLADSAAMLRELIRTTMAVDALPAAEILAAMGVDPATVPSTLNVPSGPSWSRLIMWLLALGAQVPAAAIPDVVDLYNGWSIGMMGMDPITPHLVKWLYRWLVEIETRDGEKFREWRQPFGGGVPYNRIPDLESALRTGFLAFCFRVPELAAEYITALKQRRRKDAVVESILKFRGSLSKAAPAELAELTASALIRKEKKTSRAGYDRESPFEFLDHQFLPVSPAQGPFLELLTDAPQHGLPLIRRLVDHAIAFETGGKTCGGDAIVVPLNSGQRAFPWIHTYNWSRSGGGNHYCVTSALMAIEAWAHKRIESGDDFDEVIKDVLGEPNAPAAYLLIAVDLLLSHWPKSLESALPFLACPELLAIDRERNLHDNTPFPDIFGLKQLEKEPVGIATSASLRARPSRRLMLESLLAQYAFRVPRETRERLSDLLRQQASHLGEPDAKADMRDPALMVRYAINVVNPDNWKDTKITLADGTEADGKQYVPPEAEARHISALQAERSGRFADTGMEARLGLAVDDRSKSSPELAEEAVAWARRQPTALATDDRNMRRYSIGTSAMIAMRDATPKLRAENRAWADGIFAWALRQKEDTANRFRSGLQFNLPAMAFVGIVHGLRYGFRPEDRRTLLEAASRSDPAAAHGLGACAIELAEIDERLPRSLLRCAFVASVKIRRPDWDAPKELAAENARVYRRRCEAAVTAELAWLADDKPEPAWPAFPTEARPGRRSLTIRRGVADKASFPVPAATPPPDEYADHQAAALWLANCRGLLDAARRPWLLDVVRGYSDWTANSNGAARLEDEDSTRTPSEWNSAYFKILAMCLPTMSTSQVDEFALEPIRSLPDEPFLDVLATFLPDVDSVFFNGRDLAANEAVRIRTVLAEKLTATSVWHSLVRRRSSSIDMHLGPAAAAVFFNNQGFGQPATAYLYAKGIDRVGPFLPLLERLAGEGPSLFVAIVTLNLLEVSPRVEHASLLIGAVKVWVSAFADDNDFWINHGIGRRVCALIDSILIRNKALFEANSVLRPDVDFVLAAMVRVGVAEATRSEREIAGSV